MSANGFTARLLVGLALVTLGGCAPEATPNMAGWPPSEAVPRGWKRILVGDAFSFEAPADTQPFPLEGIDSAVGGYESSRFKIAFDYGAYSNSLSDETPWIVIDGHKARLELGLGDCQVPPAGHEDWRHVGYVHVELRPGANRLGLTMSGCAADEAGLEDLRRLYQSLSFNPKLADRRDR
jgi:hypothetical protein